MKKSIIIELICSAFLVLFVYAALSKLMDIQKFSVQIGQSPILTVFAKQLAYTVPILELIISIILFIPKLRIIGLYAAMCLMVMFTTYIICILTLSVYIPCSCGGILEKMGWTEHLFFNISFIVLAIIGISLWYILHDSNKSSFYKHSFSTNIAQL